MEKAFGCALKWQITWHSLKRKTDGGDVCWQFMKCRATVVWFQRLNNKNAFLQVVCVTMKIPPQFFFQQSLDFLGKLDARFNLEWTFLLKWILWPKVHCYLYTSFKALSYMCLVLQMKFMGKGQKGKFLGYDICLC